MSTHKPSWALMSPVKYGAKGTMSDMGVMQLCSWMLISSHECCWCHRAILMSAHGCLWGVMTAYKHSWMWPHVSMRDHGHSLVLMSTYKQPWAIINMCANKHSWSLLHGANTTHNAFAPYLTVLKSALECSWVLIGALECSLALSSAPEWSWVFEFLIQ